jgi:hypothetical protein
MEDGGMKMETVWVQNLKGFIRGVFPADERWKKIFIEKLDEVDPRQQQLANLNGSRPLPYDRDTIGRFVREAWVRWAETQPNPKPSWLVPYDELSEADKEADRQIGEAVARWTLIGDAANRAFHDPSINLQPVP